MRHKYAGRKLGRKTNHRIAMWRNMAVSLFTHGQITTTLPKAKSVKPYVEKIITAAKAGDLASRRQVMKMLGEDRLMVRSEDDENVTRNVYGEIAVQGGRKQAPKIVKRVIEEIAPRYADRNGGYTRIIKLAKHRIGDGADLCVLQLVGEDEGGPQVSGQHSRRREAANKRMEFAAARRRGGGAAVADTVEGAREPGEGGAQGDESGGPTADEQGNAAAPDTSVTVEGARKPGEGGAQGDESGGPTPDEQGEKK